MSFIPFTAIVIITVLMLGGIVGLVAYRIAAKRSEHDGYFSWGEKTIIEKDKFRTMHQNVNDVAESSKKLQRRLELLEELARNRAQYKNEGRND